MRVLITGGTGFIGERLCKRCIREGHTVRVLAKVNTDAESRRQQELEKLNVEFIDGSVTDPAVVQSAVQGIDWVFHLAAAQHEAGAGEGHFMAVNVEGTRTLLDACVEAGVKRFMHGSTIGIYGSPTTGVIDTDSPPAPDNIYGISKLEGESVVRTFMPKLPCTIIRISEVYGRGDQRLLKLFRGIDKGMFFMIGRGDNHHHLVHVDDLVEAFLAAVADQGTIGQTYLIAGSDAVTTREMVDTIAAVLHKPKPKLQAPMSLFMGLAVVVETLCKPFGINPPLHRRRMDFFRKSFRFSDRLVNQLPGFTPRVVFADGAADTAAWYRQQGML